MPQAVSVTPEEREAIERVSLLISLTVFAFISVFEISKLWREQYYIHIVAFFMRILDIIK